MRVNLVVVPTILILCIAGLTGRNPLQLAQSPEQTFQREKVGAVLTFVQYYWQYESQGGRLTDRGWLAAAQFFARPIPPSSRKRIFVVSEFGVGGGPGVVFGKDEKTGLEKATVEADAGAVGTIDGQLRFKPATEYGDRFQYELIKTNGNPVWRFVLEGPDVYIGVPTAILYVCLMRQKTTDLTMRRNADRTLALLSKLKPY